MDSRSHVCQTFPLRFGSWRSRFFCSQTRPGKLFCKTFLILSRSSDWRKGHPFQKFYFLSQTFKRLNWNSTRKSQTAPPSPGSPLASIITCRHRPAAPPAEQKVSGGGKKSALWWFQTRKSPAKPPRSPATNRWRGRTHSTFLLFSNAQLETVKNHPVSGCYFEIKAQVEAGSSTK